ncbi:PBSX family phage terminase large subunit [Dyadobacter sp. 3J3]|uniref:PBSX family phage terminase large subunit n=1 Tax=Dyadobacter sp. 3J3 TaxID=2606600 RepID=UPI00190F79BE|nr:PBSX family phage terminase large subunit [Dyadobacter sp. 3J3]
MSEKYNVFVLEGGSRSSKTHSIIQFWIRWAYINESRTKRVVVARLKGTWLNGTVYKDFIDVLKGYGLYDRKSENKTNKIYTLFGTEFWFVGLDDPQKIHGMQTDAFWINEAVEASKDSYDQLMQRCKGFAILDYNPSEEEHWIYDSVCKREKTWYSHSTMLDNRLIPKNAKEQILSYEPTPDNYKNGTVDKRKWLIYGLGKRAKIEGLVFENWEIVPEIPSMAIQYQGLDFGYTNDVTALENVGIWKGENSLYMDELCYKTHMTSSDIINTLKSVNRNRKIWSESADPRLVNEIFVAGFNIHAVQKYQGSVKAGIDKMKSMKLFVTEGSLNIIKELKNYTYKQDKNGVWLNEPIDAWNHSIDGSRYVVMSELLGKPEPKRNLGSFLR